jgi:phospholipase C
MPDGCVCRHARSRNKSDIPMTTGCHLRIPTMGLLNRPAAALGALMMLNHFNRRLHDRAVVTAAILSLISYNAATAGNPETVGGIHSNDKNTTSPIKHLIVIMGENRTFDHVFATYKPRQGESVDNLLSKGIINLDGSRGPNYAKASNMQPPTRAFIPTTRGQGRVYLGYPADTGDLVCL